MRYHREKRSDTLCVHFFSFLARQPQESFTAHQVSPSNLPLCGDNTRFFKETASIGTILLCWCEKASCGMPSISLWAFNNLFLVYVLIFSPSMVAFAINGSLIDLKNLPNRVSVRFPRGLFIGYCFVLSGTLVLLWMGRIILIMRSGLFPPEFAGVTTLQTQAIDLGFVVPLLLSAGVLLRRRSPWGYFLSSITVTFGLTMCISGNKTGNASADGKGN
jgi:hypothetical protein